MMNKIKKTLLVAGSAILCWSCTDYLTTPPVGSLSPNGFYNSESHAEQGVLGVYSGLRGIELNQYLLVSEDRSDNVWVDPVANGIRSCSEVSNMRFDSSLGDLQSLWAGWYSLINNANSVIENLSGLEFNDKSLKDQFLGEVCFLRGYAHFELARTFGNVPIVDHCLSVNEAKTLGQSSAVEVITRQVIPDLLMAESLLPYEDGMKSSTGADAGGRGRADKIVVEAMLARVYMTLKGFPFNDATAKASAKDYLEKVLNYSESHGNKYWAPTIGEWKKQWLTDPSVANKYQIFSIQHTLQSGNSMTGSESGAGLPENWVPKGGQGGLMTPAWIEAQLRHEYAVNEDPRGVNETFVDAFKAYGSYVNDYANQTIQIEYDGQSVTSYEFSIITKYLPFIQKHDAAGMSFDYNSLGGWPVNFPILRIEDIMLLYAEILIEDGQIAEAVEYVNRIRERAGITPVAVTGAADALKAVKRERQLELFMEGVRWFDMVRYGEWEDATMAVFNRYKVGGEYRQGVAAGNIKTEKYLCPIPDAQLEAVPGLYKQNPGWE